MLSLKNGMYVLIMVATIVGWTIGITSYFITKNEAKNNMIVVLEMVRMVAVNPHGGECKGAPQDIKAICNMLDIVSDDLKGD